MTSRKELLVIVGLIVLASFFRLWQLHTIPPGLYPDEAMNGNNAIQAWETGNFKVFYPENNGREGLFINLQAISVHYLGNTAFALRLVSALAGILTVLGVYFLSKRLFDNWEIAAFASFLMAIGFWHVVFSRIGFRAIMAPFFAVWAFYYFWRGLDTGRLWTFGVSGILLGLGMYTYISFRVMPLALVATAAVYWLAVRRDFSHEKYLHTRRLLSGGMAFLIALACLVALPLAWYFATHTADLFGRTSEISIFAAAHPGGQFIINLFKTVGMFFAVGDFNWRHNISGDPVLFWPVAALFVVGFARSIFKVGRSLRTHGHPSTVHTLLLSWFALGLLPEVLSNEGLPHALRAIIVAPPVFIFAGEALWWVYNWLRTWYRMRDAHRLCLPAFMTHDGPKVCVPEGNAIVSLTLVVFLTALALTEGHRYFVEWGANPAVSDAFSQSYTDVAHQIQELPPAVMKYVLVNVGGVAVNGIPMSAQPVMYLTDTWTPEKQKAKNIFYVTPDQFQLNKLPRNAKVIPLAQ